MNNVFSHNTKMKPTTNCTTTIYKSLVAFIFMLFRYYDQNFVYMHFFHEKREKSSLMIVIKNVSFHKIFKILFIDSMYKRKFMVAPFHLHLRFPNGVLRLIYVSPYTYWVLENSSISNESSCTYLKQGKWL